MVRNRDELSDNMFCGSLFLKEAPWTLLWRWTVYSLVTTSFRADLVFWVCRVRGKIGQSSVRLD